MKLLEKKVVADPNTLRPELHVTISIPLVLQESGADAATDLARAQLFEEFMALLSEGDNDE